MSRIKLLFDVVEDMRSLAGSLQSLANAIAGDEPETMPTTEAAPQVAPAQAIPLEAVRAVLAGKSREGFTEEIRSLLLKYGAQKLSGVDPRCYADLLKDAEELTDAGK
ncbi:MAG: rRNA biogenesis protein rrp5 [Clostridia bacterium]|nr:rRNA biogenesis protein rrp5 [Clostridia bacterium]